MRSGIVQFIYRCEPYNDCLTNARICISRDVRLSSNMAASIVLNGNQYSFMQASFCTIVRGGLSTGFSIHGSSAWRPCWRAAWRQCTHSIIYKYIIPERLWLNLWALRFLPLYYFLRGAAPKKIVGSGRNRRPIDSTGASKKGMIYLFYIPHQQHLWKLPVTFTFLCWSLSS